MGHALKQRVQDVVAEHLHALQKLDRRWHTPEDSRYWEVGIELPLEILLGAGPDESDEKKAFECQKLKLQEIVAQALGQLKGSGLLDALAGVLFDE